MKTWVVIGIGLTAISVAGTLFVHHDFFLPDLPHYDYYVSDYLGSKQQILSTSTTITTSTYSALPPGYTFTM